MKAAHKKYIKGLHGVKYLAKIVLIDIKPNYNEAKSGHGVKKSWIRPWALT